MGNSGSAQIQNGDRLSFTECKTLAGSYFDIELFLQNATISVGDLHSILANQNDLFISHDWGDDNLSNKHHVRAGMINKSLNNNGLKIWFDEEKLQGNVQKKINIAVDHSKCVLILLTKEYLVKASEWKNEDYNSQIQFGAAVGRKGGEKIVVAVMEKDLGDPSEWSTEIGQALRSSPHVDFTQDNLYINNGDNADMAQKVNELVGIVMQIVGHPVAKLEAALRKKLPIHTSNNGTEIMSAISTTAPNLHTSSPSPTPSSMSMMLTSPASVASTVPFTGSNGHGQHHSTPSTPLLTWNNHASSSNIVRQPSNDQSSKQQHEPQQPMRQSSNSSLLGAGSKDQGDDVNKLRKMQHWMETHTSITSKTAELYCQALLAANIGSIDRLVTKLGRNNKLLLELGFDKDDHEEIVGAVIDHAVTRSASRDMTLRTESQGSIGSTKGSKKKQAQQQIDRMASIELDPVSNKMSVGIAAGPGMGNNNGHTTGGMSTNNRPTSAPRSTPQGRNNINKRGGGGGNKTTGNKSNAAMQRANSNDTFDSSFNNAAASGNTNFHNSTPQELIAMGMGSPDTETLSNFNLVFSPPPPSVTSASSPHTHMDGVKMNLAMHSWDANSSTAQFNQQQYQQLTQDPQAQQWQQQWNQSHQNQLQQQQQQSQQQPQSMQPRAPTAPKSSATTPRTAGVPLSASLDGSYTQNFNNSFNNPNNMLNFNSLNKSNIEQQQAQYSQPSPKSIQFSTQPAPMKGVPRSASLDSPAARAGAQQQQQFQQQQRGLGAIDESGGNNTKTGSSTTNTNMNDNNSNRNMPPVATPPPRNRNAKGSMSFDEKAAQHEFIQNAIRKVNIAVANSLGIPIKEGGNSPKNPSPNGRMKKNPSAPNTNSLVVDSSEPAKKVTLVTGVEVDEATGAGLAKCKTQLEIYKIMKGHTKAVFAVAPLIDGRIISGSADGALRVWDEITGKCIGTLTPNTQKQYVAVLAVHVLADGSVVSGGTDGMVRLWDIASGECTRIFKGHTENVSCVSSMGSGHIVSGSFDRTVRIWDPSDGSCVMRLQGPSEQIYAVTTTQDGHVISGSTDKMVRIWRTDNGECVRTLSGHTKEVVALVMLPNDTHVVSGSMDQTIRIWQIGTWQCTATLSGHTSYIKGLTCLPDGHVVSCSTDKTIRIWNSITSECVKVLEGHSDRVTSVTLLADGKRIATGSFDQTVRIWM